MGPDNLISDFNEHQEHIIFINDSVSVFKKMYDELWNILKVPYDEKNLDIAIEIWDFLLRGVPIFSTKLTDPWLLRARPYSTGEELLTEKWQVSYNQKFKDRIPLGRFNKPKEPLFYAAIPGDIEDPLPKLWTTTSICAAECQKNWPEIIDKNKQMEFTFSQWFVRKPIDVAVLCSKYSLRGLSPKLQKNLEFHFYRIYNLFSLEAAQFIEKMQNELSELSQTSEHGEAAYQILSAFYTALRKAYAAKPHAYQGIIYPSCQTEGKGLNVVLTPKAVDEDLQLMFAWMYSVCHRKDFDIWYGLNSSDMAPVKDDRFEIKDYNPNVHNL